MRSSLAPVLKTCGSVNVPHGQKTYQTAVAKNVERHGHFGRLEVPDGSFLEIGVRPGLLFRA